jgi:hypothetical protein
VDEAILWVAFLNCSLVKLLLQRYLYRTFSQ